MVFIEDKLAFSDVNVYFSIGVKLNLQLCFIFFLKTFKMLINGLRILLELFSHHLLFNIDKCLLFRSGFLKFTSSNQLLT